MPICSRCRRAHRSVHKTCAVCRDANNARRKERWDLVQAAKVGGCVICGEDSLEILEFHHVTQKRFSISHGWRTAGLKQLTEELRRCIVLCANCHRRHHAAETPMTLDRRQQIRHQFAKLLWQLDENDVAKLAELVAMDFCDNLDISGKERIDRFVEKHIRQIAGPAMARYAKQLIEELRRQCPP